MNLLFLTKTGTFTSKITDLSLTITLYINFCTF